MKSIVFQLTRHLRGFGEDEEPNHSSAARLLLPSNPSKDWNMKKTFATLALIASIILAATPASAGGLLGRMLFGSLDDTQAECQAQYLGNFSGTWRCIRAHVAQGHTGDMQNEHPGAAGGPLDR
jgi:hypothetical protein